MTFLQNYVFSLAYMPHIKALYMRNILQVHVSLSFGLDSTKTPRIVTRNFGIQDHKPQDHDQPF